MPFLQDYECGRGHRFEQYSESRTLCPRQLLCRDCLQNAREDLKFGIFPPDAEADEAMLQIINDEEMYLVASGTLSELSKEHLKTIPKETRKRIIEREVMCDSLSHDDDGLPVLRVWVFALDPIDFFVRSAKKFLVAHGVIAFPVISTAAAPITINRRNGDYAAREKERLTKRSKEHNRLKTSREEADANTERVVGKDTANVLFSKGLHA